jgi:hypothetical protein
MSEKATSLARFASNNLIIGYGVPEVLRYLSEAACDQTEVEIDSLDWAP